jgi:hypothetical protein
MGGEFVSCQTLPVQDVLTNCRTHFSAGIFPPSSDGLWTGLAMVFLPSGTSPQDHPVQPTARDVRSDGRGCR